MCTASKHLEDPCSERLALASKNLEDAWTERSKFGFEDPESVVACFPLLPYPPFRIIIGFRPFVEVCIDANEKAEALKYIPKLVDPRERAESYARIGMAKEAADAASQAKDGELLGRLKLTFAQNSAATFIFDTLRDRLSFQGVS